MLSSALSWTRKIASLPKRSCPASGTLSPDGAVVPGSQTGQAPESSRPLRLGLRVFIVWTVISLCQAAQYYFFPDLEDGPVTWERALGLGFALGYTWGLLGLLVFRLARRFPLGKPHRSSRIALHTIFCLAFAGAKMFIDYPIIKGLYCPRPDELTLPVFLRMSFGGQFLRYALYYWAIIAVSHAVDYYGKYRDGQLRAAQLETGLARARLQLLKTQLQPHFLFNTLNAISALVHVDVEAADRTLARLGDRAFAARNDEQPGGAP